MIEFPFGVLVSLITVLNVILGISLKLIVIPYSHLFFMPSLFIENKSRNISSVKVSVAFSYSDTSKHSYVSYLGHKL